MSTSFVLGKLKQVIIECDLHQKRIEYALTHLKAFMPLTAQRYLCLSDPEVEALDQFLFRFAKLQDAMGQRLFSGILELQEEPVKTLSFLDKLNRLEQLGAINNKDEWRTLRNMRNQLSHEYENDAQGMVEALNHIYSSYSILAVIFTQVKAYAHHLISTL